MIVDDQDSSRELIRGFLTMSGITFHECASGRDAVASASEFKPHWVTVDVKMPGMDGFETARAIKEAHPEARVIIVTSFNEPQYRDMARNAGASGFILKENLLALRLMLEKQTKDAKASASAANRDESDKAVSKRILVLDDDREMGTMLELFLSGDGCDIIYATSGREAVTLHRKNEFDLVVLELILAGKDGFETLAELRRSPRPPKIIATAKTSWMPVDVYSKMARQLGVLETLAKPLSAEKLVAAVRDALGM